MVTAAGTPCISIFVLLTVWKRLLAASNIEALVTGAVMSTFGLGNVA